jgi:hypothetical protein
VINIQPLDDYKFDIDLLAQEVLAIVDRVGLHKYHSQISLKHTTNDELGNPWYQGCGSLKYKFGEDFIDGNGNLIEQELKLEQSDFTEYNKELEGTYIYNVCSKLEKDYAIGRARIMALPHKKVMSMHTDTSKRLHLPIITNENCLMIIDNMLYHMPANGQVYIADTTKPHTALNANHNFTRYHLLFDLR